MPLGVFNTTLVAPEIHFFLLYTRKWGKLCQRFGKEAFMESTEHTYRWSPALFFRDCGCIEWQA